jgi:hypothetical protein
MTSKAAIIYFIVIHALQTANAFDDNARRILSSTVEANLILSMEEAKTEIDGNLLLYQTPDFQWELSTIYRYDDLMESLTIMATEGVAGKTFYIGEDVENEHVYGLNIAAFLAQSMKETIQYDACDENSVSQGQI